MEGVRRALGLFLVILAFLYGLTVKTIIVLAILTLIVVFLVIPSIFHYNTTIQRHMVFLPWVKWPKHVDFNKPEDEGLEGTINFYLNSEDHVRIGVWHILPQDFIPKSKGKGLSWYRKTMSESGRPIILYMHGNTGSRAREHRVDQYVFLRKLGYHVVCFDYRGYADSSQDIPTKRGVVTDGHAMYNYVREYSGSVPVFVWGHSLGTAVASQVVSNLCSQGNPPDALMLESPFNNIRDEIREHPMSFLWRKMPYFDWFFAGSLNRSDVAFFSDDCIRHIHIPILILHAKDDQVVPFQLGLKLYRTAMSSRRSDSKPVIFIPFEEEHGYAHIFIHQAPELGDIVGTFVNKTVQESWKPSDYINQET